MFKLSKEYNFSIKFFQMELKTSFQDILLKKIFRQFFCINNICLEAGKKKKFPIKLSKQNKNIFALLTIVMTWKTKFDDEKLSLSMNMPRVSEIYILEIPKKIIENRKSNASKSLFFTILCLN